LIFADSFRRTKGSPLAARSNPKADSDDDWGDWTQAKAKALAAKPTPTEILKAATPPGPIIAGKVSVKADAEVATDVAKATTGMVEVVKSASLPAAAKTCPAKTATGPPKSTTGPPKSTTPTPKPAIAKMALPPWRATQQPWEEDWESSSSDREPSPLCLHELMWIEDDAAYAGGCGGNSEEANTRPVHEASGGDDGDGEDDAHDDRVEGEVAGGREEPEEEAEPVRGRFRPPPVPSPSSPPSKKKKKDVPDID
jgi:hypothetical protein